ncbi:hypothetical protein SBA3_1620001 [Candidatus Sulfopaludibacter sp. SbA3]|nr:hypothetical protein SBA3_1620001 [Candidatus Sulfopaludibacter sp. SbA3]
MDAEDARANKKFELIQVLEDYIAELERTKQAIRIPLVFSREEREIVLRQQAAEQNAFQRYSDARRDFLNLFR